MKQYDKEFKQDAVNYVRTHPELSVTQCTQNLGVNANTLHNWLSKARKGEEFRGQGNYSSAEAKEIARLKRELKDTQDALAILKNHQNTGGLKRNLFAMTYEYEKEHPH